MNMNYGEFATIRNQAVPKKLDSKPVEFDGIRRQAARQQQGKQP